MYPNRKRGGGKKSKKSEYLYGKKSTSMKTMLAAAGVREDYDNL